MIVNSAEVDVLTSDAFKAVAPADLVKKIRLTAPEVRGDEGYARISLPQIGRPVAEALRTLAAADTRSSQTVVAKHLAERIEERLAFPR